MASVVFAVIGFSYNAWCLESTEDKYIRTASFQVLSHIKAVLRNLK